MRPAITREVGKVKGNAGTVMDQRWLKQGRALRRSKSGAERGWWQQAVRIADGGLDGDGDGDGDGDVDDDHAVVLAMW